MVSILPSERTPWDVIGKSIGNNIENVLPGAVQQGYNRGQMQQSLAAIKDLASKKGTKPLDITLAALQAGAGIPGSERYLSQLIPILQQNAAAQASQNVNQPGEESSQGLGSIPQGNGLPGFMGKQQSPAEFFPSNVGAQGGPGHHPQTATTGVKTPLLDRAGIVSEGKKIAKQLTDAGNPTTVQEGIKIVRDSQEDAKIHNAEVDKELEKKIRSQKNYGEVAEQHLTKAYPQATPEQKAIFKRKGELAAAQGDSEADIDRKLANEAKLFKNSIVNVEKDMSAPRLQNVMQRGLNGTYKNLEEAGKDLRSHLKPILDLGLYDTARNLLAEKGYGNEEIDSIINPLSERAKIVLNQVPKIKMIPSKNPSFESPEKIRDLQPIKEALTALKKADPNFSLVLARKALEDKGYDWRLYKDALNELEDEGSKSESGGFKLESDQNTQKGNLDSPPLNILGEILHGLNLIGR